MSDQNAIEKWQICDEALVDMLSAAATKAREFLQDSDIAKLTENDVWVDGAGQRIDPAWHWLLDIVVLLAYESTTGQNVKGNELPLQEMLSALQAPSRRESLEAFNQFLAVYTPGTP